MEIWYRRGSRILRFYLKACASIQVLPEFAIALEDAPSGIRSAAAAGMRPVMIPDLVEPDEAVLELVWRRFDTLYDCDRSSGIGFPKFLKHP